MVLVNLLVRIEGGIWQLKRKVHGGRWRLRRRYCALLYRRYLSSNGSFVGLSAQITSPPVFPHGIVGVFISNGAVIGEGCVIFHQVTIGSNTLPDSPGKGAPIVGSNVYIGAGAKIIGNVRVGNNVRIGANAVVVRDVPDSAVVVPQSARVIQREIVQNRFDNYVTAHADQVDSS